MQFRIKVGLLALRHLVVVRDPVGHVVAREENNIRVAPRFFVMFEHLLDQRGGRVAVVTAIGCYFFGFRERFAFGVGGAAELPILLRHCRIVCRFDMAVGHYTDGESTNRCPHAATGYYRKHVRFFIFKFY